LLGGEYLMKVTFKNTGGLEKRFVGQDKPRAPFVGVEFGIGEKNKPPFQTKVPNIKK